MLNGELREAVKTWRGPPLTCSVACLQVQDEAAGLVVLMLDPQPGERILDACAAPGGKAMFAAILMQQQVCCPAEKSSLCRGMHQSAALLLEAPGPSAAASPHC